MKKRIFISVTNDISYDQRILKTASSLCRFGYEVTIVGRYKSNSIEIRSSEFKIHRFKLFFTKGKPFYLEYALRLSFYLLTHSMDILCAVDLDTILPNVLIGKWKSKPVIYDAHEYFTEVPELTERKFEKTVWKFIEKFSIPRCVSMYTVGEGIADLFRKEYRRSVDVIYNYPRLRSERVKTFKEKPIVIYQGDLNEGRGVDKFLEAMHWMPYVEFWVAGDGYDRSRLEQLAKELDVASRVRFLGYISPEKLGEYTQKASLGINLLENKGLNYFLSIANKFFDYIQSGVPVLTMNFPEYQKINDRYQVAVLIDDLSPTAIRDAVSSILTDEDKYNELVKNCDIANRFLTWESQEEKLRSIYRNVE